MGRNKTGFSNGTKDKLLLGAGAIFKNFVVGVDTYDTSKDKIIAATQGGNSFSAVPSTHNIQIDGILGKASDLDVIDYWDVSLEVTFIEASKQVICAALGASTVDTSTNGTYDIIRGDTEFKVSDYFENITYIGTISGSEEPVIIQVNNCINLGGLTFKTEDGKEGTIGAKFEGRYTTENQTNPPFVIYYPKGNDAALEIVSAVSVGTGKSICVPVQNVTGTLTATSATTAKATVEVTSDNFIIITGVAAGTSVITVEDGSENTDTCTVTVTA